MAHSSYDGVDVRTVQQVAQGDKAAFAALHEALKAEVSERVCAQLSDARQVESVVSATFLEMRRLARFHAEPVSDIRGWVRAIVDTRIAESLGCSRDAIEGDQWWAGMASAHDCQRELDFRQLFD